MVATANMVAALLRRLRGQLQGRLLLLWAAPLLLLDQGSKSWALATLADSETVPLLPPFLQLTLVENRGMVFGLFPERGDALTVLALLVVGWLPLAYPRIARGPLERWAAVLVMGGALGNLLDRLRYGYVVDFVHLEWPGLLANVSNFADHALVLGALLWALGAARRDSSRRDSSRRDSSRRDFSRRDFSRPS